MGAVGANVLGGELVVTYRYSTGAAAQTETVRYYVDQDTTNPGTATSTFATSTATISNSGKSVKNVWFRVQTAPIAAANLIVGSEVGTATKKFKTYALTGTNVRAGDSPIIVQDMTADIGNFFASSVALGGESRALLLLMLIMRLMKNLKMCVLVSREFRKLKSPLVSQIYTHLKIFDWFITQRKV
jgi:hypothetical protein